MSRISDGAEGSGVKRPLRKSSRKVVTGIAFWVASLGVIGVLGKYSYKSCSSVLTQIVTQIKQKRNPCSPLEVELSEPHSIDFDGQGNLYVGEGPFFKKELGGGLYLVQKSVNPKPTEEGFSLVGMAGVTRLAHHGKGCVKFAEYKGEEFKTLKTERVRFSNRDTILALQDDDTIVKYDSQLHFLKRDRGTITLRIKMGGEEYVDLSQSSSSITYNFGPTRSCNEECSGSLDELKAYAFPFNDPISREEASFRSLRPAGIELTKKGECSGEPASFINDRRKAIYIGRLCSLEQRETGRFGWDDKRPHKVLTSVSFEYYGRAFFHQLKDRAGNSPNEIDEAVVTKYGVYAVSKNHSYLFHTPLAEVFPNERE